MRMTIASVCALAALALAACNPPPEGRDVAAAMPDTDAARAPNQMMTAPDAGATGAAEPVPLEGGVGNVAGSTVPNPGAAATR